MSNKKIVVAITAILLVAAIIIISEKMMSVNPPEHRMRLFPDVDERGVTAIVITEGGVGVRLEKDVDQWTVSPVGGVVGNMGDIDNDEIDSLVGIDTAAPMLADAASVQIAVEKIIAIRKTDPVSENPEKQAAFETDSAGGTVVEIYTAGKSESAVLYIGKPGTEWNSNYIRRAGTDVVYLLRGGIKYSLFTDIERWKRVPPEPAAVEDSAAVIDSSGITGGGESVGSPE